MQSIPSTGGPPPDADRAPAPGPPTGAPPAASPLGGCSAPVAALHTPLSHPGALLATGIIQIAVHVRCWRLKGPVLLLAPLLEDPITPWLGESITEGASSLPLIMKETAGLPLDTEEAAGLPPPPQVIVQGKCEG